MPLNLRLYHAGVSGMKNMFDKKVEDHRKTQLDNPFSEWEGAGRGKRRLSKDDEYYGKPLPGSESERRAQVAQHHIMMDIKYLCDMIWDCSEWKSPDGRAAMTFGKLFNLYNAISDKVVGTLLRARKHGFVHFEGEMLYQRRDDDKVIELARNINTIRKRFGEPPLVTGGGEAEPWYLGEEVTHSERNGRRRNSTPNSSTTALELNQQRRRHSISPKHIGHKILQRRPNDDDKTLKTPPENSESDIQSISNSLSANNEDIENNDNAEEDRCTSTCDGNSVADSNHSAINILSHHRMDTISEEDRIAEGQTNTENEITGTKVIKGEDTLKSRQNELDSRRKDDSNGSPSSDMTADCKENHEETL